MCVCLCACLSQAGESVRGTDTDSVFYLRCKPRQHSHCLTSSTAAAAAVPTLPPPPPHTQWHDSVQAVPEIQQVIQVLELTTGIERVGVGRQAEVAHTVAQVSSCRGKGLRWVG